MPRRILAGVLGAVLTAGLTSTVPARADSFPVRTIQVPDDYATIQAAVDAANPGDAILVHPGVYNEGVEVTTPNLTIRGSDRNMVVLDGGGIIRRGFLITSSNVEVSNLTLRNYRTDGVKWSGPQASGYAARYLTAYNNGDYGIFAFDVAGGVFEDSYTSGNPDSGFYIGGCNPCDAVIQRVVAEHNGLGYSGTNAGGNLIIRDSVWNRNGAGLVPNSLVSEPHGPQHDLIIERNVITDNGNPEESPGQNDTAPALGMGIGIAGGNFNQIRENTISGSGRYGVVVFPFPSDSEPNVYPSIGNKVQDNVISSSGLYDVALAAGSGERNCFSGNANDAGGGVTSDPPAVQTVYECSRANPVLNTTAGGGAVTTADLVAGLVRYQPRPCTPSRCPVPGPQPTMPDPAGGLPGYVASGIVHCVPDASVHARCGDAFASIQAAVDASSPGDAILIGPGRYHEAVLVPPAKTRLIIRGTDRNAVVLDGEYAAGFARGIDIEADDVEVSNITVTGYSRDGVRWIGQTGYLGRYVTAYNNGLYGLYAFRSRLGRFEDSYASGIPDGGYYIGECEPCDAVIQRVTAENNGLGFTGTNASGNLVIQDSVWNRNSGGILPNTLDSEALPPQHGIVIRRNLVTNSGDPEAPSTKLNGPARGAGIAVAGGNHNLIEDNVVTGSTRFGIALAPYPETTPNVYRPVGNEIRDNVVSGSGFRDLAVALGAGERNCFSGNTTSEGGDGTPTSDPPAIQDVYACSYSNPMLNAPVSGGALALAEVARGFVVYGAQGDYRTMPAPGPQPSMPDVTQDLP